MVPARLSIAAVRVRARRTAIVWGWWRRAAFLESDEAAARLTRDHRLNGASFRRQVPIANYIADFVCHAARLAIELDGGQHFSDGQAAADARRSAIIEARGFRVLRFSNHDVMTNREGVLETIVTAIKAGAPTLTLPHKGGGSRITTTGGAPSKSRIRGQP